MCQPCIFGSDGTNAKGRIAKFRNTLKSGDRSAFYNAKKVEDVSSDEHTDLLEKHLPTLRENGIGILSGEIEDLFFSSTLLDGGKLTLESVYDINDRRSEGDAIDDMMETEEIETLLSTVLNEPPSSSDHSHEAAPAAST